MSGATRQRRGTPQTRSHGDSAFAVAPATFFLAKLGIQFSRGRRFLRFAPGLATLFPFRGFLPGRDFTPHSGCGTAPRGGPRRGDKRAEAE